MKAKKSVTSAVGILLVIGILVVLNLIANTAFVRLDLTEAKIFTLAKASKKVVSNLDEPLTVKVFASENLSPQLNDVKRYVNDLLAGYKNYGGGNFRYEFIDPGSDEELEKQAQDYRIPPFQENVWNKDNLELKRVYLGAVFLYGDRQEVIPTLQTTSGLEYQITSLIKRLTSQQEMTVGFVTDGDAASPFEQMQQAVSVLQGNYKVTTVDLASEASVPDNVDALLLVQPKAALSDTVKYRLDQYLMGGRPMGIFSSPVETDLQRGFARDSRMQLDLLTDDWGVRINSDLVADKNSSMINIQERRGFFTVQNTVNYPFFPNVTRFNEDHPVTGDLDMISLFFASSIDTTLWREKEGVRLTPLMYSGEQSMVQSGRYTINATQEWQPAAFDRSGLVLGAALEGSFPSAYSDGAPAGVAAMGEPVQAAPAGTRLIVVGDGNFVTDEYMMNPANVYLLLNSVDWLVKDTDLIQLRTREVTLRPLDDISDTAKQVWKWVNWFVPPLLAVIIGLLYWQMRRSRRYGEEE